MEPITILIFALIFVTLYIAVFWLILWLSGGDIHKTGNKKYYPSLSILIPAYNEQKNIARTIEHALALNYPSKFEVIVRLTKENVDLETLVKSVNSFQYDGHTLFHLED